MSKETRDRKEYLREYMRNKRALAKASGIKIPSDDWAKNNPDKHREKTARWRSENFERSQEINRSTQKTRRSTPWGKINNRMWPCLHYGVKSRSTVEGKYTGALGYKWRQLAEHLEAQFTQEMNWDNWGAVWELDHIKPVSSYRYESIDCDTFKECWGLNNLRPLLKVENQKKGGK